MKLSIIIPLYNAAQFIEQCLNSVLNQNLSTSDYEIIVIDDGSTDSSLEISKCFAKKYHNISVYAQENGGVSVTRNRGIDLAKGAYIWFIDGDDFVAPNVAMDLYNIASSNNLDLLEFKLLRTKSRAEIHPSTKPLSKISIAVEDGKDFLGSHNFGDSCCTYFWKTAFLKDSDIRFIPDRIIEDMTFNAEIIPTAKRAAFLPVYLYRYVINPKSLWTDTAVSAFRKSIDDFVHMTIHYNDNIKKWRQKGVNTIFMEKKRMSNQFNIAKRMAVSDYSFKEMNRYKKLLKSHGLYPIPKEAGNTTSSKLLIFVFNRKYLFYPGIFLLRLFKKPIEFLYVERYRSHREEKVKEILH